MLLSQNLIPCSLTFCSFNDFGGSNTDTLPPSPNEKYGKWVPCRFGFSITMVVPTCGCWLYYCSAAEKYPVGSVWRPVVSGLPLGYRARTARRPSMNNWLKGSGD